MLQILFKVDSFLTKLEKKTLENQDRHLIYTQFLKLCKYTSSESRRVNRYGFRRSGVSTTESESRNSTLSLREEVWGSFGCILLPDADALSDITAFRSRGPTMERCWCCARPRISRSAELKSGEGLGLRSRADSWIGGCNYVCCQGKLFDSEP